MNSREWDREIAQQISSAMAENNWEEVGRLLRDHPENLLYEGDDLWLTCAAAQCSLEGVKAIVQAGVDVNASTNTGKGTPFHLPEGPILMASTNGCTDVVAWLLERGAKINFEVNGERRCLALLNAIRSGHKEIVSLLVEHGADIHAVFDGNNATTLAENAGRFEIRDYLVSKGGIDLRDMTAPEYSAAHKLIDAHFAEVCGGPATHLFDVSVPPPVVHVMHASGKRVQIVYTNGLSDRNLPRGAQKHACSELMMSIPLVVGRDSSKYQWAMSELARLVRIVVAQQAWFASPVVPADLGEAELPFVSWLVWRLRPTFTPLDYRSVRLHELIPLFQDESETISRFGIDKRVRMRVEAVSPMFFVEDRERLTHDD